MSLIPFPFRSRCLEFGGIFLKFQIFPKLFRNIFHIFPKYFPNIYGKIFPGKIFLKSHIFSIYMQNRFHIFPIFCFPFPVSWIRGKYGKSLMKEFRQRASCFPIYSNKADVKNALLCKEIYKKIILHIPRPPGLPITITI